MPRRPLALLRSLPAGAFLLCALLAAACSRSGEALVIVAQPAAPEAATAALVAAAPTRVVEPPRLSLPEWPVPQGASFAAIVLGTGVAEVQVTFAGRTYPAVADGGLWLSVVGVGQRVGLTDQHEPGVYPVQALVTLADRATHVLSGEVSVAAAQFPVEYITLAPAQAALLDPALVQRELAILLPLYTAFTPQRLWDGYFLRPTGGLITDVYGSRRSYNGGPAVGSHSGVDFGADAGTPVYAAAAGRVVLAEALPVRGNGVLIDHGAGVFTGYFHLSAIRVEPGQEVAAGDQIGNVGATGLATGPHLHWEVVVGGYQVDGLLWLQAGG